VIKVGVDIGGTFTDIVLADLGKGIVSVSKVPTTPDDYSSGVMTGIKRILKQTGHRSHDIDQIIHATTIVTNSIIEGKVAKSGFITTKGFKDILEIQRQIRTELYDFFHVRPRPLVPRHLCYEVSERIGPEGDVLKDLDEDDVISAARELMEKKVESIAVCLLHSYMNPSHERRVKEIIKEKYPLTYVSLSSEVCPHFREYFRASTTVVNAVTIPIAGRYISNLKNKLKEEVFTASLYIMQSSGGIMTSERAIKEPVYMVESGPAAGTIVAKFMCEILGWENIISFDMGGTTTKASLLEHGEPMMAPYYEVGATAQKERGATKGSGYPIMTPVIDLIEVGAGGGSIGWIDPGGALKVGPISAGAKPGPVCYGIGGTEPTVTDANLVLGRINPHYFLGGRIKLDVSRAREAINNKCADPLGVDLIEASRGIVEIANSNMIRALRNISVERGYDPREYTLVAFGGAGPMHINSLADELKISKILVPPSPGTITAMGLLMTDLRHDYNRTILKTTKLLDLIEVQKNYEKLDLMASKTLRGEGFTEQSILFTRSFDMRYLGQSYELNVPIPTKIRDIKLRDIEEDFHRAHERVYGHKSPEEPIQVVNLKLTAIGLVDKPKLNVVEMRKGDTKEALKERREVFFVEEGLIECDIYDRYRLYGGYQIEGPAIIEEADSTTVLHPNYQAQIDQFGDIIIHGI